LHYIFYENNRPINPEKIKNSSGEPLPAASRPAFEVVKEQMLQRLAAAPMHAALMDTIAGAYRTAGAAL